MVRELLRKGITRRGFLRSAFILGLTTISADASKLFGRGESVPRGRRGDIVPREAMYYRRLP
ncbi:MAG: hypothetical protein ACUVXI_04480 [bacterium]